MHSDGAISNATRQRLAAILECGELETSAAHVRGLWKIAQLMLVMDYSRPRAPVRPRSVAGQRPRGRRQDREGDALIEHLWDFWTKAKGVPPTVSNDRAKGIGGPFVHFAQAMAGALLADLDTHHPVSVRTPLRQSLKGMATNPSKVWDRLRAVERFWALRRLVE